MALMASETFIGRWGCFRYTKYARASPCYTGLVDGFAGGYHASIAIASRHPLEGVMQAQGKNP